MPFSFANLSRHRRQVSPHWIFRGMETTPAITCTCKAKSTAEFNQQWSWGPLQGNRAGDWGCNSPNCKHAVKSDLNATAALIYFSLQYFWINRAPAFPTVYILIVWLILQLTFAMVAVMTALRVVAWAYDTSLMTHPHSLTASGESLRGRTAGASRCEQGA